MQDFFQSTVVVSSVTGGFQSPRLCRLPEVEPSIHDLRLQRLAQEVGGWFLLKKNSRKRTGTWKYTKLIQVVLFKRFYLVSDVSFCLVDPNVDCLFDFWAAFRIKNGSESLSHKNHCEYKGIMKKNIPRIAMNCPGSTWIKGRTAQTAGRGGVLQTWTQQGCQKESKDEGNNGWPMLFIRPF